MSSMLQRYLESTEDANGVKQAQVKRYVAGVMDLVVACVCTSPTTYEPQKAALG